MKTLFRATQHSDQIFNIYDKVQKFLNDRLWVSSFFYIQTLNRFKSSL